MSFNFNKSFKLLLSNGKFKTDMKTQNLYKITKLGQERIVNGQIR